MKNQYSSPFLSLTSINILILFVLLLTSSYNIWKQSKVDVESFITTVKQSLFLLGNRTVENKEILLQILENPPQKPSLVNAPIYYHPKRNEYGFNNNIHESVLLNGTLLGSGNPPESLLKEAYLFPYLEKTWSRSTPLLLSYDQFYTSYRYKFIYSIKNRTAGSLPEYLEAIVPNRYLSKAGSIQSAQDQLRSRGFYLTHAYRDAIDQSQIIAVITPVHYKGQHIGDMGVSVPTRYFSTLNNLPTLIRKYGLVSIQINGLPDPLYLTQNHQVTRFSLLTKRYEFQGLGSITLVVPPTMIISGLYEKSQFILIIMLLFNFFYINLIRNKKERFVLHTKTITDDLTGIYNRRIIDELASYTKQQENSFSLIVMDANKFKTINDTYGHQAGDLAIKHIARTLTEHTRKNDACIRMGGDEFCIVLPDTTQNNAEKIALSLKEAIESEPFSEQGLFVYISFGVSQQQDEENFDETYKRADKQLYLNKKNNDS